MMLNKTGIFKKTKAIIEREFKLTISKNGGAINIALLFALMIILWAFSLSKVIEINLYLFPLTCICSIFATQISLYYLFESDFADGFLEQLFLQQDIFDIAIAIKIFTHWIFFGFPLVILSVIFYLLLSEEISFMETIYFGAGIFINTLAMTFISAVGQSLLVGEFGSAAIAQVVSLPVVVPIFIYSNILFESLSKNAINVNLLLFGAIVFILTLISSALASLGIRVAIENE